MRSPQTWNRYSYVQNDPANLIDPRGTSACGPIFRDAKQRPGRGGQSAGYEDVRFVNASFTSEATSEDGEDDIDPCGGLGGADGGLSLPETSASAGADPCANSQSTFCVVGTGQTPAVDPDPDPEDPGPVSVDGGIDISILPIGSTPGRTPCPPVPAHPGLPNNQIQTMINQSEQVLHSAMLSQVKNPIGYLFGFWTASFLVGGQWDFKDSPSAQGSSSQQAALRVFGNFAFGATLSGMGYSLYFTQNAAGVAQIAICLKGGACGSGVPLNQFPFGDQAGDQADIIRGWQYEQAVKKDCK